MNFVNIASQTKVYCFLKLSFRIILASTINYVTSQIFFQRRNVDLFYKVGVPNQ